MAELNQHDEIAGGVDRGAFYAVMSAMASRDPKRVALAECDAYRPPVDRLDAQCRGGLSLSSCTESEWRFVCH